MDDLFELSATAMVELVRRGEVSPVELVSSHLAHISQTEPDILAWETLDPDGALAAARLLERNMRARPRDWPLCGVPVGIKDTLHVRGLPTRVGFDPYRDSVADEDAAVVELLRNAGAIPIGKTVTVQFAWADDPPQTRNPWDATRTPGGSSSGSAAAVAAKHVPIAIGTQAGGSLLRPASYCGVVGLKPTFGRVSRYGLMPTTWSFDHVGVLGRSVQDVGLVLDVISKADARDSYSARFPADDLRGAALGTHDAAPRFGVVDEFLELADEAVRDATSDALERLTAGGAVISHIKLPASHELVLAVFAVISCSEGAATYADDRAQFPTLFRDGARANAEAGQLIPATAYVQASRLRRRLRTSFAELMRGIDALVCPTTSTVAPPRATIGDFRFQSVWSVFGYPALTVPLAVKEQRLPAGLQFIASYGNDVGLLRLGAWAESILPGHNRVPR